MKSNFFYKILYAIMIVSLLISTLCFKVSAEEDPYIAENGIVEIYAGISDTNDNFYRIKNCSGFLVSNSESGCYIVTTTTGVTVSQKERKDCLKNNRLKLDDYNYNESIKVVVNGDVETSLTVVAKSQIENFAILQAESVINEKETLKLGNTVEKGDTVYSLGFVTSSDKYMQYDKDDVVRCSGTVKDFAEGGYICHTAYIDDDCSGGPLVNEDGYVVGLNDSANYKEDYYSLGIENVKKILDNYAIEYSSLDYDQAYAKYNKLIHECKSLVESGNYTTESVEEMNKVIEGNQSTMTDKPSLEELVNATNLLKNAKSRLVVSTPVIHIVIYILLGVLVCFLSWLVYLLIVNKKHNPSKRKSANKNTPTDNIEKKPEPSKEYISEAPVQRSYKVAYLKKPDTNMVVKIDKRIFALGSKADEVDFTVRNKAVSRKHATIKLVKNEFYIFDENSANGTYVNDVIVDDEGKILKDGDLIALANEQFVFEEKSIIGG